jgi:hypothetical protein
MRPLGGHRVEAVARAAATPRAVCTATTVVPAASRTAGVVAVIDAPISPVEKRPGGPSTTDTRH